MPWSGRRGSPRCCLPVLNALSAPILAPGLYAAPLEPAVASQIHVSALGWWGPVTALLYRLYPVWVMAGLALLVTRYGHGTPEERRRIRWLFGWLAAVPVAMLQLAILWTADPGSWLAVAASLLLWPVILVLGTGSLVAALFAEGVFGIDEPSRRRLTRRALRVILLVSSVAVAVGLGLIAGRLGGTSLAVVVSVGVVVAARPVWRGLEAALDRWLFGARLDGYDMLAAPVRVLRGEARQRDLHQARAVCRRAGASAGRSRPHLPPRQPAGLWMIFMTTVELSGLVRTSSVGARVTSPGSPPSAATSPAAPAARGRSSPGSSVWHSAPAAWRPPYPPGTAHAAGPSVRPGCVVDMAQPMDRIDYADMDLVGRGSGSAEYSGYQPR